MSLKKRIEKSVWKVRYQDSTCTINWSSMLKHIYYKDYSDRYFVQIDYTSLIIIGISSGNAKAAAKRLTISITVTV